MKRTTVMIPPDLKARAEHAARERGISFGQLVRDALDAALAGSDAADPLFADEAVYGDEAPSDLAAAHDRYLYGDPA